MEELTALRMRGELREYLQRCKEGSAYFSECNSSLFYFRPTETLDPADLQRLFSGLSEMGYVAEVQNGMIQISPEIEYISHCAQETLQRMEGRTGTFSRRLMQHEPGRITDHGRMIIFESLRLAKWACNTGNVSSDLYRISTSSKLMTQIKAMRQHIALLLRNGEHSGLYEAGIFLMEVEQICAF